ncbi:IS701 family transposase [Micromonospora craniellae]|nr:IS701 family transposase [Micromonospora craniellae]
MPDRAVQPDRLQGGHRHLADPLTGRRVQHRREHVAGLDEPGGTAETLVGDPDDRGHAVDGGRLVRDDVRGYVVEHLGDPAAVLVADETGFLKKGIRSVGVQRQCSGTAGRTENCQIGTFLCYASGKGRALIDRELYLPMSWTEDRQRCRDAAIPDEVAFGTKPQQARAMLERAVAAGVPFAWFTADEAYGQSPGLRGWLQEQDISYVMATRCDDQVAFGLFTTTRVDALIAKLPARSWTRLSCGDGALGPRRYDWARLPIRDTFPNERRGWVLARRSISDPTDIAYYVCFGPRGTRLRELVRVAGSRWAVEESFQTAKNEVGLDQCQVRRYDAWYAHITLAMTAAAFLVATRATEADKEPEKGGGGGGGDPAPETLIPLSSNEIRRLFTKLVLTGRTAADHVLHWSNWRRHRQAQAKASHYRKRLKTSESHDPP